MKITFRAPSVSAEVGDSLCISKISRQVNCVVGDRYVKMIPTKLVPAAVVDGELVYESSVILKVRSGFKAVHEQKSYTPRLVLLESFCKVHSV